MFLLSEQLTLVFVGGVIVVVLSTLTFNDPKNKVASPPPAKASTEAASQGSAGEDQRLLDPSNEADADDLELGTISKRG
jgi:hypothetical protein